MEGENIMFSTFRNFFNFCGRENKSRFYKSIIIAVINAFFQALKIPAIAVILNGILNGMSAGHIVGGLVIMLVSIAGSIITYRFSAMIQTVAGYETACGKRIEIAEHLRYLPMGYFNKNSLGEITSVTTNTMENLGDVATRVVMMSLQGMLTAILMIIFLLFFDWRIGLLALGGAAAFFVANTVMRRKSAEISEMKIEDDTRMTEKILEYIQGILEVKTYNMSGLFMRNLTSAIDKASATNTGLEMKVNRYAPVQNICLKITATAMIMLSVGMYLGGGMQLVNCILMVIASFMVFHGLEQLGAYSALLRVVDICVEKANAILKIKPMDIEGDDIYPKTHDIKTEDIEFSYTDKKIIDGISLNIPQKTTTAFVGPSGSGKTTLCHLLARFWDVDSGSVNLSGRDVRDYSYDSLMANYSFVFQNVYLFHDTIANNIRFGEPEASMERVTEAAKKACCHDFIMKLPDGYDTVIGEGGASLSGGEKQRISIARAILKDAPIIILDEATANVDPENERELMGAIEALTKEKTIFMIAHRLKTVQNADKICVVDKGRIVQEGTHEELMARGGIYREFVEARKKSVGWRL